MGFDDLEAAEGGADGDASDETLNDGETEDIESTSTESANATGDPRTTPAFPFEATKNNAQYVLESVAKEFDDAWEFDVKRYLARERGIQNVEKREWQTAVQRFAAENPEKVAELIIAAREEVHGPIEE